MLLNEKLEAQHVLNHLRGHHQILAARIAGHTRAPDGSVGKKDPSINRCT